MKTVVVYHTDGTKTEFLTHRGIVPDVVQNYRPDVKSKDYRMQEYDHFAACRELKRRHGRFWERTVGYSTTELKEIWGM